MDEFILDPPHITTGIGYFMPNPALIPKGGSGFLAGSFPDGITSVEGVPAAAVIRVFHRGQPGSPDDGSLVAETASGADGVWVVTGLNPSLKYDVICRHEGYNDMILSNVSPVVD